MKTLLITVSALMLLPTTASAKFFRDLQPLDAWIADGGLDFLHHKSDGQCCDTDCEPLFCDEASTCHPAACLYAPNMIGGGNTLLRPFGAG